MTSLSVGFVVQNAVRRDGQGRVAIEVIGALTRRGHQVTVYAHDVDDDLAGSVAVQGLRRWPTQMLDDVAVLIAASAAIRRAGHHVVCTLGPTAITSRPTVYNVQFTNRGWIQTWDRASRPGPYHRLQARWASMLERWCARHADHVIASTAPLARELDPESRVPTTIVANGLDLEEFPPVEPEERESSRSSLGISADEFVVAFLGDYHTPRKGLEPLLHAVSEGPSDERLVVAARGDDRALSARIANLGLEDRVIVAGFVRPQDVYAAADVVAVPSLYEPFSLVTLEAAARQVPIVVSSRAGASALLGGGGHVLESPADPKALRSALDAVRRDPIEARRRASIARAAVADLTWSRLAEEAAIAIEHAARSGVSPGATDVRPGGKRRDG